MVKANIIKVKVYPKDLKSIPDILPFNKLLQGEPKELKLDKSEILRCMNFGDVYDLTTGDEVLIDEISFKEIVEFVEDTKSDKETENNEDKKQNTAESESTPSTSVDTTKKSE